jgi:ribose 5-phosphate isomerase B
MSSNTSTMNKDAIWIGNDHGGYEMKQKVVEFLKKKGFEVNNIGTDSMDSVCYPFFAAKIAGAISGGSINRGILICSTGIGMSIIANKYKGVRAALCTDSYMAKMTRSHNDSNILCLGGKITGTNLALDIVDTWLYTAYEGGRHNFSLSLIAEAEEVNCKKKGWIPKNFKL